MHITNGGDSKDPQTGSSNSVTHEEGEERQRYPQEEASEIDRFIDGLEFEMSGDEYKRKFKEHKLFKMSHLVILEHDEMAKKLVDNCAHLAIMKIKILKNLKEETKQSKRARKKEGNKQ